MMVSHVQQVQKEYSRSALEAEEARSPLTRASLEAGVRVLKLATSTARVPSSTGMPAWVIGALLILSTAGGP